MSVALGLLPPRRAAGQDWHDGHGIALREGRTFTLHAAPGSVRLAMSDEARRERARARLAGVQTTVASILATWAGPGGPLVIDETSGGPGGLVRAAHPAEPLDLGFLVDPQRARCVTEWSRKSRARMARRIAELDIGAWLAEDHLGYPLGLGYGVKWPLGMLTLTYPGDWLAVAPSGRAVKRHLRLFALAWKRAYGRPLACLWKLEFQRRGAPHFHLLVKMPTFGPSSVESFELWVSREWARIVGATGAEYERHLKAGTAVDFAANVTDPRRIGVYFAKHGAKSADDKEYQHVVPVAWRTPGTAPGRFWGRMGIALAVEAVEVDFSEYVAARRVLRRVLKVRSRRVLAFGQNGGDLTGGTVLVNDGPAVVSQLARWLTLRRRPLYDGRGVLPGRHPWP